jgi:hypothetical protein
MILSLKGFQASVGGPWTSLYLRLLAIVLTYGAVEHIGNILGWSGRIWTETPLLWQVMDVILLLFNLSIALGLWWKQTWAVIGFVLGMITLQWIPYTCFRSLFARTPVEFQTLNGLLGTEFLLVAGLVTLLILRK